MNKSEMIERLSDYLPEKRIRHSLNVAKAAVKLCEFCGCDKEKAEIAGILHDTAKYIKFEKVDDYCKKYGIELDKLEESSTALSHSLVGAYIARYEFGIEDREILDAIRYHTTGRANMKPLEKAIYLADLIELGRDYPGVEELREMAYSGKIDEVIVKSIDNTITLVLKKKSPLHTRTVEARNYYIHKLKSVKKG
ncbi:bis(5'-nucleosyl)-tetraphosphatase (symmetrical) YqeK [Peptostreptococcus russellii]|uniref:bis(5'-nucleosyl)-tetraphosphatase (symmetrical) YqeK n=1 Tax=Peptostreptococcus russellii TaxID=215200 RepID=UPI003F58FB3C